MNSLHVHFLFLFFCENGAFKAGELSMGLSVFTIPRGEKGTASASVPSCTRKVDWDGFFFFSFLFVCVLFS